jgi:hypothetical protein
MRKYLILIMLAACSLTGLAQGTRVQAPANRYTVNDDVRVGQRAAMEVERQVQVFPENGSVDNYIERVGRRLVAAIPPEFRHPQFNYQFEVVDSRELNAFALPGGWMYVNRGMVEAARTEGELAGVMAHEIAHVALRHGTAQVTKAQSPSVQLPALGGAILGAIIGGTAGSAISQGAAIGSGAYFLKFSREYETQADILGAQIMAQAGYDPRDLANMFRTIEQQGRGGGPVWLSSHPNPGDRYERINNEASMLAGSYGGRTSNDVEFRRIKNEIGRESTSGGSGYPRDDSRYPRDDSRYPRDDSRYPRDDSRYPDASGRRGDYRVEPPSPRFRTYTGSNLFRINVPENWRIIDGQNSVTFAPEGAFVNDQRATGAITHGAIAGVVNASGRYLRQASDSYVNDLLENNPYLSRQGSFVGRRIDGRNALSINLEGRSPITGRNEIVTVYTALLDNNSLFYVISVAPLDRYRDYDLAFQNMINSVDLDYGRASGMVNRY